MDQRSLRLAKARVRVVLPLSALVRSSRCFQVAPDEFLNFSFKYERMVGLCYDCFSLNHVGTSCPLVVQCASTPLPLATLSSTAPPSLVFRVNIPPTLSPSFFKGLAFSNFFKKDSRDEEDEATGKRAQHALDLIPSSLQPEALGLSLAEDDLVEVVVTTDAEVKRNHGRPRGQSNKPKLDELVVGTCILGSPMSTASLESARKGKRKLTSNGLGA
ncbi:hypothetical protein M0R45_026430 [Rubus argutus]|uniref:Zinc knuckle CX2CX4HX4C domain-containing protein n=1 Tax=Rubus argutus TaxID=59490 RepID=A0AAW1WZ97_RUBAR